MGSSAESASLSTPEAWDRTPRDAGLSGDLPSVVLSIQPHTAVCLAANRVPAFGCSCLSPRPRPGFFFVFGP